MEANHFTSVTSIRSRSCHKSFAKIKKLIVKDIIDIIKETSILWTFVAISTTCVFNDSMHQFAPPSTLAANYPVVQLEIHSVFPTLSAVQTVVHRIAGTCSAFPYQG